MVHNVKLGKNMRSVSIVGIGATPFFNGVQNETYKGLTNGELFGHAALDAMKDAGVEPRDVQYFFHGSANPHVLNNCITPVSYTHLDVYKRQASDNRTWNQDSGRAGNKKRRLRYAGR